MRHWIAWIVAVTALLHSFSMAADVVTLTPSRDNTIFSSSDDRSNALGVLFTSTTSQANTRRTLLAFDVAGHVPPGSTITAARLTLTLSAAAGDGMDIDHRLHRLLQAWGEGTSFGTSGNGAPATPGDATWGFRLYPDTPWSEPGGDFVLAVSANAIVGDEPEPITWGSTPGMIADVQTWLDSPELSHGWILLGEENVLGTARKFVHRESANEDARPSLTIEFSPTQNVNFRVTRDFSDDNTAEVEVTLSCNTGLPLEQTTTIDEGDGVNFVVGDFEQGTLDCEVTEAIPAGYRAFYEDDNGGSEESCSWVDLHSGQYACRIENNLLEVEVEVTKTWIDERPGFNPGNIAEADWSCQNLSDQCDGSGCDASGSLNFNGNPDAVSFFVLPDWETGTHCSITEVSVFDGSVEIDDRDCQGLLVFPGQGASCTIFNTRLFAGIPALGQYGLGILVLMMLGIGFVAFRRFI